MTRNTNNIRIRRDSAGNYTILVDGIKRGDITRREHDGWWNANFCNEDGDYGHSAIAAPTKREIVWACKHNTNWNDI
jgi:hypothetical protein